MKSDEKSADSCPPNTLDLPLVGDGEEPLEQPEPSFAQVLAHAKLLLSWQGDDFLEKRRALMQPEPFVIAPDATSPASREPRSRE